MGLDSAALQGDMAKRFNLAPAPIQRRGGGAAQAKPTSAVALLRQQEKQHKAAYNEYKMQQQGIDLTSRSQRSEPMHTLKPSPPAPLPDLRCASCHAMNRAAGPVCSSCGYFLAGAAGSSGPPARETLAQRRGLVPTAPEECIAALTPLEWTVMEKNSQKRNDAFCPICMEAFKQGREVLLSCSHMFHHTCLQAFEKFMGRDARTCPICRAGSYQKKLTHVGSKAFEQLCAGRIQRVYRGYAARKVFRIELKSFYKLGAGAGQQSAARRRFFEKELSLLGNSLAKETEARARGLNNVVRGIDRTLDDGKELDVLFDAMLQQRQQALSEMREHTRAMSGISGAWEEEALSTGEAEEENDYAFYVGEEEGEGTSAAHQAVAATLHLSDANWAKVLAVAQTRGLGECAICMAPNKGFRQICALSCSHLFHTQCIVNFEKFVSGSKNSGCPVCRSPFVHRGITTSFELISIAESGEAYLTL
jgi:hypothetical protein